MVFVVVTMVVTVEVTVDGARVRGVEGARVRGVEGARVRGRPGPPRSVTQQAAQLLTITT